MNSTRTKLCVMMLLEFIVWGAWLPLLKRYLDNTLHFESWQSAWVFNAFALASLTGMFFGGQLADRYFAQEKFLAFSHLIGGLAMIGLNYAKEFYPVFGLMLLHCFFYVPTISITNAITFANLKESKDFGFVRAFGTIGWIVASWPYFVVPVKSLFLVSGVTSLVLAAFCLTLPHTPPVRAEERTSAFAPLEAFKLLAVPSILVLFVVTFFDALVHNCYFFWTSQFLASLGLNDRWISASMSIGQIAEIATMAGLAYFLKRLGWRTTMILGILGHVVRFAIYSIGRPDLLWLVILSNVVHGFAYAFFFATVYIFVNENFPKDIRTSAQSLFNLLILGLGPLASNFLSGWIEARYTTESVVNGATVKVVNFSQIFLYPLGLGIFSALILTAFFHPPQEVKEAVIDEPAIV
jgi:nucleoside transporter